MEHIKKIELMEEYLNTATTTLAEMEQSLEKYVESHQQIALLSEYYGSEEWFEACAIDEKGGFPQDLRRGVLTQDLVYNLLIDNHQLAIKMLEAATKSLSVFNGEKWSKFRH